MAPRKSILRNIEAVAASRRRCQGEKTCREEFVKMEEMKETAQTFEVEIEKLVYGGSGFARHEGKVIFVPYSVPGDRLLVRPIEEKKSFVRAEIVRIVKPGEGRVTPFCPHFQKCGGCHLQQLDYGRQVEAKLKILQETFHHRFPQTREMPIQMRACPSPMAYRSRARIQMRGAGEKASLGFFRPQSHIIEDVASCPLFRSSLNEALSSVRQFKFKVDEDPKLQQMDIACSEEEDSWATARAGESSTQPGITPLLGTRNTEEVLLRRKVGEFTYFVTASAFFQANDFMVSELVSLVREMATSAGSGSALDLFSGVGLFSLPLAMQFQRVLAVENSASASKLCTRNAGAAGVRNIQTVCADVLEWLRSQEELAAGSLDLAVLDPPRTGTGSEVIKRILKLAPRKIIYVSCDPQTLVRDLTGIPPGAYVIRRVEGLDLFPQTYHFETVVELQKN